MMTNLINIQYGSKVCQLPKSLVNNEEFMKEIVSANVWNNKLKKSDKMNLLKYLPSFSQNDTHEKKETLKKLFLGKPINFENQIKKFVRCVKEGEFSPNVKSQKVLDLLLTERKGRLALLKRRVNDLKKIVESKKSMGIEINDEEIRCLEEFSYVLTCDDPLDSVIDERMNMVMDRVTLDPDIAKQKELYHEYDDHVATSDTSFRSLNLDEVVNRCQNDNESGPEDSLAVGPMTRKRRQLQNGFEEAGLRKYARLKWERESSDSQSESSEDGRSNVEENSDDSPTSDTDSVASTNQRRVRQNRHERREFRCPTDDFTDFFSLLQRLFVGAHQHRLTTAQVEERVRHWQTVHQREIGDEYNRWAVSVPADWVALVVPALSYLCKSGAVARRAKSQWWHWRRGPSSVTATALEHWYRDWRGCQDMIVAGGNGGGGGTSRRPPPPPSSSSDNAASVANYDQQIAPALYPTEWRVRPSSIEERLRFQGQERRRFARPYRAFTYNVHGYCCAVSPIRGCVPGRDYSGVRARGHALLVSDRPAHVTIVEIVRDAVARLPNGEGSRQDIVCLAMDSAYWTDPGPNDRTIGQCISSALDRLQGEGCDPSVKYNARLKLWFYRHRGKTVEDLEEMHLRNCREELRRGGGPPGVPAAATAVVGRPVQSGHHHHQQQQHQAQQVLYQQYQAPPVPQGIVYHQTQGPQSRPSYQQFSRAVATARDSIMQPFNLQRHIYQATSHHQQHQQGIVYPANGPQQQPQHHQQQPQPHSSSATYDLYQHHHQHHQQPQSQHHFYYQ